MKLKDVSEALQTVGFLKTEHIKVYFIYDRQQPDFRSEDRDIGFLKAMVSPEGEVMVTEMHINPDKVEKIRRIFAHSDVKIEEMPWV